MSLKQFIVINNDLFITIKLTMLSNINVMLYNRRTLLRGTPRYGRGTNYLRPTENKPDFDHFGVTSFTVLKGRNIKS